MLIKERWNNSSSNFQPPSLKHLQMTNFSCQKLESSGMSTTFIIFHNQEKSMFKKKIGRKKMRLKENWGTQNIICAIGNFDYYGENWNMSTQEIGTKIRTVAACFHIRPSVNNKCPVFFSDFTGNSCTQKYSKAQTKRAHITGVQYFPIFGLAYARINRTGVIFVL